MCVSLSVEMSDFSQGDEIYVIDHANMHWSVLGKLITNPQCSVS